MAAIPEARKAGLWVRDIFTRLAEGFARLADVMIFVAKVVFYTVRDPIMRLKYLPVTLRHISDIVVGAGATVIGGGMVFVIFTMSIFVGGIVGIQGYVGLSSIGAESFMGIVGSFANVREVTPIIAAVALASQVGSSFTAELGAMRINEEIDALEVMGINSFSYLICTRVIAGMIALTPLYLVSLFASFFATRFMSVSWFGLSPGIYDYYFHLYLPPEDLLASALKIVIFAFAVMTIHCYYGYYASGGPVGVGVAAGQAIKTSIIIVVLLNMLLTYIFWGQGSPVRLTG